MVQNFHIDTSRYGASEGWADQITLPNGKYGYTGIGSCESDMFRAKGWHVKTVHYFGACISSNINGRAHDRFPIQIEGVSVADFINKIATEEEFKQACRN